MKRGNKKVFTINNFLIGIAIIAVIFAIVIITMPLIKKENVETYVKETNGTEVSLSTESTGSNNKWDISKDGDGKVIAQLNEEGILTISGFGKMQDYAGAEYCPWYEVAREIEKIKIENGVTNIGNYAFSECTNLESVEMPISLLFIGNNAFEGCTMLSDATIPNSVICLGSYAFSECKALREFEIPKSVKVIGNRVLDQARITYFVDVETGNIEMPDILKRAYDENDILYSGNALYEYDSVIEEEQIKITDGNEIGYLTCGMGSIPRATLEGVWFVFSYNEWDVSEEKDGSVMATLSEEGVLSITGTGRVRRSPWSYISEQIRSVQIAEGITGIEPGFSNCVYLRSLDIPSSVEYIGYPVQGCKKLESINVHENNERYVDIDGVLYKRDGKKIISYPAGKKDKEYEVLSGVEAIVTGAFNECSYLEKIELPSSLGYIDSWAFSECSNLKEITIPNNVWSIRESAFQDCVKLTKIELPESVSDIEESVFKNCASLANITIPSRVDEICEDTFYGCTSLTDVVIQGELNSIGNSVFRGCEKLTNINLPNTITSIGNHTFYDCKSLVNLNLPTSLTSLGKAIFWNCTSLEQIIIPEGVTEIQSSAFCQCSNLSNISLPNTLTTIGNSAFYECDLTSIIIPESVTNIGDYAFERCTNLTSIEIPSSVITIGKSAFNSCEKLTEITILEGIINIEPGAFHHCTNLTSIEIPSSVEIIKEGIFGYCENLTEVIIPEGVTEIQSNAFNGCTNLSNISLPNTLTTIGNGAFYDCDLTSIIIPESVTSIGGNAFAYNDLIDIQIENNEASIGDFAFGYWNLNSVNLYINEGTNVVELPNILKQVLDENNILFSSEGLEYSNCTLENNQIKLVDQTSLNWSASIKVCSGILEGYTIYIKSRVQYVNSTIQEEYLSDGTLNISGTGEICIDYYGDRIKNINIGEGITSVILRDNDYIKSIKISSTVTNIEMDWDYSSVSLSNLIEIDVNENNQYYSDIDGVLFTKDKTELIIYPAGKIEEEYNIPEGVTIIGENAFSYCNNLESIKMPNTVTTIENNAFSNSENLSNIQIPASVTNIGKGAFDNCRKLVSINVDDNNLNYLDDEGVLYTKDNQKLIKYPSMKENKQYKILEGTTIIGEKAIFANENIEYLYMPDTVTELEDFSIENCYMKNIRLSNSLITVGKRGVNAGYGVHNIEVPNNVVSIKDDAFDISGLDYIIVPENVTNFEGIIINEETTIICTRNSPVLQYAIDNNLKYVVIDELVFDETENSMKINPKDNTIRGISPNAKIEDITGKIENDIEYEIIDPEGNVVDDETQSIGTGYSIKLETGNVYIIIIWGDLNGDSKITISELARISRIGREQGEASPLEIMAIDIDSNGEIKVNDLAIMSRLARE